ncbi:hypothetical protein K9L97_06050 [Candidatus Woesearchaeota archaeon]|nr:hypothetical protein [Candidatus Woesearchaeota archaeon]
MSKEVKQAWERAKKSVSNSFLTLNNKIFEIASYTDDNLIDGPLNTLREVFEIAYKFLKKWNPLKHDWVVEEEVEFNTAMNELRIELKKEDSQKATIEKCMNNLAVRTKNIVNVKI